MYLLPFVKYLKDHVWRLVGAFICMVLVSALGVVSILILIPPLKLLFEQQTVPVVREEGSLAREDVITVPTDEAPPAAQPGPDPTADFGPETPPEVGEAEEIDDAAAVGAPIAPDAEEGEQAGESPQFGEQPADGSFGISIVPERFREQFDVSFAERRDALVAWYRDLARNDPYRVLYLLCGALIVMVLIKGLAEFGSRLLLAHTFYMANLRMREDAYRSVLSQDFLFFTRHQPGYLISRINSDTGAINSVFEKLIADGIQQPLNILAYGGALIYLSPRLTLVSAVTLPFIGGLLYFFSKSLRKITRKQKKKSDKLSGTMVESFNNVWIVKAFGTEAREIDKAIRLRLQLFEIMMRRRVVKFAGSPIFELMGTIAASGVVLLGGYVILGGGWAWLGPIDAVEFGFFIYLLSKFYRPLKSLSNSIMKYQVTRVSAERLLEIYNLKPVVLEAENPVPFDGIRHGVEFRDVWFRYGKKEILRGINLEMPRGKMIALVGETGSGKTTIANLLARLFDPTEGEILIDGVNLREFKISDFRKKLGVVTQDTVLFDDTVENNIMYGHEDTWPEEERKQRVRDAARAANADKFIRELDGGKGYKTRLGTSGKKLSGGQRQRIAIARALFCDPDLIIMDEATSALDSQTQALVQEAINHVLRGRTSLVISHRLSTVRSADTIYVLVDGRVAEAGSFAELMERQGEFFRLYQKEALAETA